MAAVVGVLVKGPVALQDIAGVDVVAAEKILHWLTVVAELHHLALEVGPLIDAHAIGALAYLVMYREVKYRTSYRSAIKKHIDKLDPLKNDL